MRIAYVCADPGVPVFGRKGCSIHVQEVVRALARRDHEITLFATRVDGEAPPDLAGIDLVQLPAVGRGAPAERERAALAANADLTAALEGAGPFDLVYERYALWSRAAMETAGRLGAAALLEVNAPLVEEQARYRELVHHDDARAATAAAFAAADTIVAVSDGVGRYLEAHPAARGKVHVVPNGVDPARFTRRDAPPPDGVFTVGFVGTLKPWHGLEVLVDAFARLHAARPRARLLIVGDGPHRDAVAERLEALGIARAALLCGGLPHAEIPARLAGMDIAVAPYPALSDFYFSPMKLFEYMAAGTAIVASAIGQIPDVARHEREALLVPPGDAAALAAALVRLHDDPALARRLGAAAARRAQRCYTWDRVAERIVDLAGDVCRQEAS